MWLWSVILIVAKLCSILLRCTRTCRKLFGVTVDAKEGHATFEGYEFNLVDLPGTYSLSAYSPEEMYVQANH